MIGSDGDIALPVSLPAAVSSFLGRDKDISTLAELTETSRLITLTGAPGIGKSRLALEVARQLHADYHDGARLVELAEVSNAALVPGALASVLSVGEVPGHSLMEALSAHLRKRRLLLVLDNCEHLVETCAELGDALLRACPKLKILATSREPLSIDGERVWHVPPLSLPPAGGEPAERLIDYGATRLFVERASALQPGFAVTAEVAPAVTEICRRLDGIPLAIELAAARIEILTPAEIAGRLDDRFALLRKGSRSVLPRHQTLQAALDWSHDLLPAPERALLRRLSVFAGGFGIEAAEAVCAGREVEDGKLLDLLARLAAKSLVVTGTDNSEARYTLLETVRAYSSDRLEESGETAVLRETHARFHLALAQEAEPELSGPRQQHWLDRLELERENLRLAADWSLAHGQAESALRISAAMVLFWRVRCHFTEGRDVLQAALVASDGAPPALRAKALWGIGFLALMMGDVENAVPALEESLSQFRELGDRQGSARALLILGNCKQHYSDPSVLTLLEESIALARNTRDTWCLAHSLAVAGFETKRRGELSAARALFEESVAVAREAADKQGLRFGLLGLGWVAVLQGDYRSAEYALEEAVAVSDELGDEYIEAMALQHLGELALGRGEYSRAREVLEEAMAVIPEIGPGFSRRELHLLRARVAHAEGDNRRARLLLEEALDGAGDRLSVQGLQWKAELAVDEGDPGTGRQQLEKARDLARAGGDKAGLARALHGLGLLTRAEGDSGRAAALHNEALQLQREVGDAPGIADSLEAVAGRAAAAGNAHNAARLLGAAEALRERIGCTRAPWERSRYQADLALVRKALSVDEFASSWAEGSRLATEEAVNLASRGRRRQGRPASGWGSLTDSEQQVAVLVSEGLANAEIAERLLISLGTVKAQLSRIFSKLGVVKRSQLAREVERHRQQSAPDSESRPKGRTVA